MFVVTTRISRPRKATMVTLLRACARAGHRRARLSSGQVAPKMLDDAGVGERLDEGILLGDGPAIVTRAERGSGEGRHRIFCAVSPPGLTCSTMVRSYGSP